MSAELDQAPAAAPVTNELYVVFQVADVEYVVPARDVLQLEAWEGATPVPGAPSWVRGLVQVRGQVVPVIDLRRRFGREELEPSIDHRLIVIRRNDRVVGLLADRSREVMRLDAGDLQPPPDVVRRRAGGFVRAVANKGNRLLMLIDFDSIVREETSHGT